MVALQILNEGLDRSNVYDVAHRLRCCMEIAAELICGVPLILHESILESVIDRLLPYRTVWRECA